MILQIIKNNHIIDILDVDNISETTPGKLHVTAKWDAKSNTQDHLHVFIDNQHILSMFDLYLSAEDTPSFKVLN